MIHYHRHICELESTVDSHAEYSVERDTKLKIYSRTIWRDLTFNLKDIHKVLLKILLSSHCKMESGVYHHVVEMPSCEAQSCAFDRGLAIIYLLY